MKNKKSKSAFTLVELIVVILVVAILVAVLVPTFISVVNKAKLSVDKQTVDMMNIVLIAEEKISGKPDSYETACELLRLNGLNVPCRPVATGYWFYWDSETNRVLLWEGAREGAGRVIYPDDMVATYGAVTNAGNMTGTWTNLWPYGESETSPTNPSETTAPTNPSETTAPTNPSEPDPIVPSEPTYPGIVNGLYYGADKNLYTGTVTAGDKTYNYKNGMLVVSYTTGVAGDDGTVYHYTIDNIGSQYLTDKVVLDTKDMSEAIGGSTFVGNSFGGQGFKIENKTDKQFVIFSISADSVIGNGLKNGFTQAEIEALRAANSLPRITRGTDFNAYLETIKDLNNGTKPTPAKYVELYNAGALTGRTFTQYLKSKYGISENGSLFEIYSNNAYFRNMVTNTALHGSYPDTYWTDANFDGLIGGDTTDQYHVEPELIRFLLDIQYNHAIGYTFHKDISSVDSYNTPDDIYALYRSIKAGDKKIIKQQGAYWIDLVNNSGDFTAHLYNYAAMDNGDVPSNVFTTSADGKTISGSIWLWWHPYLAGNAYNNVTDEIPIIEIILSVE